MASALSRSVSGGEITQAIGIACFIGFFVWFHYEVQDEKAIMKQEKACFAASNSAADIDACFEFMKLNEAKH